MKNKTMPRLRFKEFNEEWKENKLGNIAFVTKLAGFEFTKYVKYSDKGKIIALRGLNIINNSLNLDDVKYIDNSNLSKLSRSKLKKGDIVFTYVGTLGRSALINVNNKYYLAPNVAMIRSSSNNDSRFLHQLISSTKYYRNCIFPLVNTSSQPALSMKSIRQFKLIIPSLPEQYLIGSFFAKLDKLISLNYKEINLLKKLKRSYLQKMFPQKGSSVPRLRFKGFKGEWKVVTFKDILNYEQPTKYRVSSTKYTNSGLPVLTANKRFLLGHTKENRPYDKHDCIIFDDFTLDTKFVNFPFMVKSSAIKILTAKNSNIYFDYERLNTAPLFSEGHKRHYISLVQNFRIHVPSLPEQKAIASFFQHLDNLINKQIYKLKLIRKLKKSYLQKMFV